MKLDLFTRVVLSIIAVCAIPLVARSFGLGESSGNDDLDSGFDGPDFDE